MAVKSHTKEESFLDERARQIFEDLGYNVTSDVETELLEAERDGKHVQIALMSEVQELCPYQWEDDKYCFMTEMDEVEEAKETACELVPSDSDWVVIGVDESTYRIFENSY